MHITLDLNDLAPSTKADIINDLTDVYVMPHITPIEAKQCKEKVGILIESLARDIGMPDAVRLISDTRHA